MCYYFQGMLVMMYKSFYLESYCDINRAKQPLIVECSDDKDLYKSRNHDEKIMMWIHFLYKVLNQIFQKERIPHTRT